MAATETFPVSVAIFCKVVDNYGDIGICWRLSKQLRAEHDIAVTIWVDDLASFHRLCPEIDTRAQVQSQAGVTVRHWQGQNGVFLAEDVAEIVIEFFGCDIPDNYIAAMAACSPRPVWLNLEGLSAEQWVEGCHTLSSPHPRLALTKYFFFPGFTDKTGGLLHEANLPLEKNKFQSDLPAVGAFLGRFGVTRHELHSSMMVSLFCYPHAPITQLFDAWQRGSGSITCLVPEGVASAPVQAFLGAAATAGSVGTHGALTVRVMPFITQPDYDKLLWACDLNFVRGEDSFVRAQWAGKPFVWHIYPQDEKLHHTKLVAFLQRYAPVTEGWRAIALWWNAACPDNGDSAGNFLRTQASEGRGSSIWSRFIAELPTNGAVAAWEREILAHGDLTSNLLAFARSVRSRVERTTV